MFMPSQAVRPDKEKLEKNIALRRVLTIVVTQIIYWYVSVCQRDNKSKVPQHIPLY